MPNPTKCLTSISPDLRSGASPGRRLLAVVLSLMLALGSISPGIAFAGEVDSEGEGTAPTVEVPVAPDFDPGGEETGLGEVPAAGGDEETGAVEVEPEVESELPVPAEVTSTATTGIEAEPQPAPAEPEVASAPETEPVQQASQEPGPSAAEPVANQSLEGPSARSVERHATQTPAAPVRGSAPPATPPAEEAPRPSPSSLGTPPPKDHRLDLAGKRVYVVQPGDCLWHIAAALLPAGADELEIEDEVARLWRLNEDRIGTGDPSLIYAGTELLLR